MLRERPSFPTTAGYRCETPVPTAGPAAGRSCSQSVPASGQDGASGHRVRETALPVRLTFWWKHRAPRPSRSQTPVLSAQGPRGALGGGAALPTSRLPQSVTQVTFPSSEFMFY